MTIDYFGNGDEDHIIRQDGYDLAAYEQAREDLPELADVEQSGEQRDPTFRSLAEDIHASLYKRHPIIAPGAFASDHHREIIEEMMQTTEWDKLRATTVMNEGAAALGTIELAKRVSHNLPVPRRDARGVVSVPKEITLIGAKDRDAVRRTMRKLLEEAKEATEEGLEDLAVLGRGWGSGQGGGGTTDVREVAAVRSRIQRASVLRDIMTLAGRMRRMALRKHADRVRHGPDELVDVELGAEVSRALPSELSMLVAHPALRLDFFVRLAERRVLQYRMEGREKQGRGPIVVAIDTSASMRGRREVWSKALALGLLAIAIHERRQFGIILFSGPGQAKLFEYERTPAIETVIASLEFFYNGGTDYVTPLDLAMDLCETSKHNKADIIFITDDECGVSPEWEKEFMRRREARGTRLYSIILASRSSTMATLSDGICHIYDTSQDAEATDLAFGSV